MKSQHFIALDMNFINKIYVPQSHFCSPLVSLGIDINAMQRVKGYFPWDDDDDIINQI